MLLVQNRSRSTNFPVTDSLVSTNFVLRLSPCPVMFRSCSFSMERQHARTCSSTLRVYTNAGEVYQRTRAVQELF